MAIDEKTLRDVVTDVCSGILGLALEPAGDSACDGRETWCASIRISGGWESLVQVILSQDVAVVVASDMFAVREDELCEAEIRDAVGEIVSMIGGCLTGMIEDESSLSLPCVSHHWGEGLPCPSFDGWCVTNRCRGGLLIVRLLEDNASGLLTMSGPSDFGKQLD